MVVEWKLIDTAPRTGEPFLLYKADERMVGPYILVGYWQDSEGYTEGWVPCGGGGPMGYWSTVTDSPQGYPTHWAELPEGPR